LTWGKPPDGQSLSSDSRQGFPHSEAIVSRRLRKEVAKADDLWKIRGAVRMFFFEKKNQKTFASLGRAFPERPKPN
jgi:hypothetical protein